jgi:outer membrane receptor protein involved in Fe transport
LERLQIIPSNDYGGMAQWTMPVGASSRLLFGGDVRAILAQSDDRIAIANNQSLVRGKQIGTGLFSEWIAHPVAALTLTAGVRWDYWKSFDGERQQAGAAPLATQDNVASVLNPKLSVQYNATERLRMGASVYQAFRAPTLNELYREFGFAGFTFQANERLAPERLTGTEAKLEADLLPQGRLSLRVTGHYDVVKDQIIFVTLSPASAQRQNVGEARSVGADVELTSRVRDTLLVNLGYSYVDSTITSSPGNPAREGLRIPNVSRHQLVAGVTIGRVTTLQLTVQARYLSRQYADDLNRQPVADFVLLDASLRKRVWRGAELFVNGENLTDRHYIATQTGTIKTLGQPLLVIGGVRIEL